MELPRFVMFKSLVDNDKYLCNSIYAYNSNLFPSIKFDKLEGLGTDAVHQVVMAECGGGLVHLRSIGNGKYWCASGKGTNYSVHWAAAEPVEDQSSDNCTLFKPSFYRKEGVNAIQLQHLMNGKFTFLKVNSYPYTWLSAGNPTLEIRDRLSCIAVSWVPLMTKYLKDAGLELEVTVSDKKKRLPRFVVFKSAHNNKYLCCEEDEPYFLKFNGKDAMNPYSKHEVVMAECGYGLVHIKCCATGKYWGRLSENDHWIVAGADETEEDLSKWSCTLFWPYYDPKEDDNIVQLYFSQLGENTSIFQNCLTTRKSRESTTQKEGLLAFDWETLLPKSPQSPPVGVSNDGIDAKIGGGISVDDINKIVGGLAIEDDSNTIIVGGVSIKISQVVYELKARFVASSTTSSVE